MDATRICACRSEPRATTNTKIEAHLRRLITAGNSIFSNLTGTDYSMPCEMDGVRRVGRRDVSQRSPPPHPPHPTTPTHCNDLWHACKANKQRDAVCARLSAMRACGCIQHKEHNSHRARVHLRGDRGTTLTPCLTHQRAEDTAQREGAEAPGTSATGALHACARARCWRLITWSA